jgi:hypothetical protein
MIALAGCGLFGSGSSGGTTGGGSTTGGGTTGSGGFGMPTLEVTVNGVHAGPAAPDASSYASLINNYDSTGDLTRSSLQIVVQSTSANASCQLFADRFGEFSSSFGVGNYALSGDSGISGTGAGEAVPQGSPAAATGLGVFSCSGSACDGVGLSLMALDAQHAEGFFSGNLSGASVVCAFYLPMRTFQP